MMVTGIGLSGLEVFLFVQTFSAIANGGGATGKNGFGGRSRCMNE
jgi:hypothetical protein